MSEKELDHVFMWTDGSSVKKKYSEGFHGGSGCYLECNGKTREISNSIEDGTNNISELSACIHGLQALKKVCKVTLYTDSQYSISCITKWYSGWKRRGWKTASGGEIKNLHLIHELYQLCHKHNVELVWVKGHNGDLGNEKADELACVASKSLKDKEEK
tara:strand:+ start:1080 stop:1556 length:477 start_codon:yes stop_codon:yes gene_type:complete